MLISWATYTNLKARMFWVKQLNLSHQTWPSGSQPCIRIRGPGVPFPRAAAGREKTGTRPRGGGSAGNMSLQLLTPHSASWLWGGQLCRWALNGPALVCLVPCDVASGNLELNPCNSTPQTQVTWSLYVSASCDVTQITKTRPLLSEQCSCEDWVSQGESACTWKSTRSPSPSSSVPHTHCSPIMTSL